MKNIETIKAKIK